MPPNILSIFTVLRGLRPTKFGQFFSLSEVLWSHLTFFHNSGTMNFLSTWPIHLISLPLFYAMPYVVHLHRMWLLVKYTGDFDNLLPRCNNERAERLIANNPKIVNQIHRLDSLHYNMLESFTPYCGAVLAAQISGVPRLYSNYAAILFLGARLVHWICYCAGSQFWTANLRFLSYAVGMTAIIGLYCLCVLQYFS